MGITSVCIYILFTKEKKIETLLPTPFGIVHLPWKKKYMDLLKYICVCV